MGKAINQTKTPNKKVLDITLILYLVSLIAFLVTMPFLRGLMVGRQVTFSENLNISFLFTAVVVIFCAITQLKNTALQTNSRIQHVIWILPLSSLLSQINPASTYFASLSTTILVQAVFIFIVSYVINKHINLEKIMYWSIYATLFIFVIFGLMNWLNTYSFFGLLGQYQDAVWNSGTGKRLASVFQYPNTYAAFLILFSLISLFGSIMAKTLKQQLLLALPLVASLVSLLLTESRWGWLSFPVIFILCLPFFSFKKQLQAIITLIVSGIITLLIVKNITNSGIQLQEQFSYGKAIGAWLILIIASLINCIVPILLNKWLSKNDSSAEEQETIKIINRLILPVLFIILGALGAVILFGTNLLSKILPAAIADRIASINLNQHSVLERFTFYRDALAIAKDYLVFGTGGGGWSALYQSYQNNPYTSTEVHSYFIQLLLENGLIGFIITLIIFVAIYVLFISSTIKTKVSLYSFSYFIIATTILINSALDFHMSFGYTVIFLFIALGGMLAAASHGKAFTHLDQIAQKATNFIKLKWIPLIYVCGALIFGFVALNHLTAFSTYDKAYSELNTVPYTQTLEQAHKAAKKTGHPELIYFNIQLLIEGYKSLANDELLESAKATIAKYNKLEPYNELILRNKFELAKVEGNTSLYIEELTRATKVYKYEIKYYELLLSEYALQLTQASIDNNQEQLSASLANIHKVQEEISQKIQHLETLPEEQVQGRPFNISQPIAAALGQASYIEGDDEAAKQFLESALDHSFSYEGSVQTAIYYAAYLAKHNQDISVLLSEIINATGADEDTIMFQITHLIGK